MTSGPARTLRELVLVAIALGGLVYGTYWRSRVNDEATQLRNDRQILELYRKMESVEAVNDRLLERISELAGEQNE